MPVSTSILIRVQALGGKFLGPDIGYSLVTVRDVLTGDVIAQGVAEGDSGVLTTSATPPAGATVSTVITGDAFQWLSPTPGSPSPTAGFIAAFDLDQPQLVEVSAAALTNGVPNDHVTSARVWLPPSAQLISEPGLVLVMPGLNVQILTPNPAQPATNPLSVTAWVTMMCGCKISDTTDWPPGEFTVTATVLTLDGEGVANETLALQETSVFGTTTAMTLPSGAGNYQLVVTAVQESTSNSGSASMYFAV